MDLRFLVLGAILPDLVDTPVGLVLFTTTGTVRLAAHSLVLSALVMVVVVVRTRRGQPRKRWMPLAIGMLVHLALDAMWASLETLWWPFLGTEFSPTEAATVGGYVVGVLTDLRTWALELVGLVYLMVLGNRGGLGGRDARRRFLATGVVDVPMNG